jgi:hypothetical protein
MRLYNEFCLGIDKGNASLVKLGYLDTRRDPGLTTFNPKGNLFIPRRGPLDQDSACSVESALRTSPDKNIFLLQVGDTHHSNTLKYVL